MTSKLFHSIETGKLYVYIIPNRETRRRFHQYLEKYHPEIIKVSLRCNSFPLVETNIAICGYCGCPGTVEYRYGIEPNNIDEWYSGWCNYCSESLSRDCQGSGVMRRLDSNLVVLGNKETFSQIGKYNNKKTRWQEDDLEIVPNHIPTPIIIDAPITFMGRTKLAEWVDEKLNSRPIEN